MTPLHAVLPATAEYKCHWVSCNKCVAFVALFQVLMSRRVSRPAPEPLPLLPNAHWLLNTALLQQRAALLLGLWQRPPTQHLQGFESLPPRTAPAMLLDVQQEGRACSTPTLCWRPWLLQSAHWSQRHVQVVRMLQHDGAVCRVSPGSRLICLLSAHARV
jgi:hypothetical protein